MTTSTSGATNAMYYNVDNVELPSLSHNAARTTTDTTSITNIQKNNDRRSESLLSPSEPLENNHSKRNHHNDSIGSIAFFIHVIVVITLLIVHTIDKLRIFHERSNSEESYVVYVDSLLDHTLPWYVICIFLNIFLIIVAMRWFTNSSTSISYFIKGSIIFNHVIALCWFMYSIYTEQSFIMPLFLLIYVNKLTRISWKQIEFMSTMIEIGTTMIQSYIGILSFYAYTYLLQTYLWLFIWFMILTSIIFHDDGRGEVAWWIHFVFFIFSLFWTASVLYSIVRVTTASFVGRLCLSSQEQMMDQGTTSQLVHQSHKQSIWTSFGSICVDLSARRCCNGLPGNITWSYTSIFFGLDGTNYDETVANMKNFFNAYDAPSPIMAISIYFGVSLVGISIAIISALYTVIMLLIFEWNPLDGVYILVFAAILPFYLGYTMSTTLFAVLCTTIDTMIVCYYRNPNEFETNHPQIFARLTDALQSSNHIQNGELV